ncbi:MAG: RNA methyltransferase [Bacteroidetes bacterium]|nr:MAG: RNA methyltransferase [Bacteroidota bacterium]
MISKAKIKLIQSLKYKKYRTKTGLFVAEGVKTIQELLNSNVKVVEIFGLAEIIQEIEILEEVEVVRTTVNELKKISFLSTSTNILALFEIPDYDISNSFQTNFLIALDGVQDPGNLGTIIRLADWYGIKNIICSTACADVFNPKVIQSTMGSIARVNVYYTNLPAFLQKAKREENYHIYGSFMDGESIYATTFNEKKILIMGNEGNGISDEVEHLVEKKISIPANFEGMEGPESLNVAIASAIIVSEISRTAL